MGGAANLVAAAAALTAVLAENQSPEELSLLGNLLMMVGQNLATMAELKSQQGLAEP